MRFIQIIAAIMAVAYVTSQYWQERRRLAKIKEMNGRQAKVFYEGARKQYDQRLLIITIVFCAVAIGLLGYTSTMMGPAKAPSTQEAP